MAFTATALLACLTVAITQSASVPVTGSFGPSYCHDLECPKFTVLNKTNDWELRHYESTKWVSTNATAMNKDTVNSEMFQRLFRYITGANVNNATIPMTTPVVTQVFHGQGPNSESDFIMHFMLPFAYWDQPIQPTDPAVAIRELPAMDVYIRSFGGMASDADYQKNLAELSASLSAAGLTVMDSYFFQAGYDGPYTFFNRHNEVWIQKM